MLKVGVRKWAKRTLVRRKLTDNTFVQGTNSTIDDTKRRKPYTNS